MTHLVVLLGDVNANTKSDQDKDQCEYLDNTVPQCLMKKPQEK